MAKYASTSAFSRTSIHPILNDEGEIIGCRICITVFHPTCPDGSCMDMDCTDHTFEEGDDRYECNCT